VEELPCELVREWLFLGSGVPVKQLRSWEESQESKVSAGNSTQSRVSAPNVRKTLLSRKAHEKTHVHRARFNGRPKLPAGQGKDGAAQSLGEQWLL
jgi:hypothetical protein